MKPCVPFRPSFNPGVCMVRSVFAEPRGKSPFVRSDIEFYKSFTRPIGEFKYLCSWGLYSISWYDRRNHEYTARQCTSGKTG